jgi:hypothetical protein
MQDIISKKRHTLQLKIFRPRCFHKLSLAEHKKWVFRAIWPLPSDVFCRQISQNLFSNLGDTVNNRFLELSKPNFIREGGQNWMLGLGTRRIIDFPTSNKSQDINKQCQATTWNISFSTSKKSPFLIVKSLKKSAEEYSITLNYAY